MMSLSATILSLVMALPGLGQWRPFLDPLPLEEYFMLFLLPLIVVIAVVYKTIKLEDLSLLPRAAGILTVQIVVFMALAAVALWLVTELM